MEYDFSASQNSIFTSAPDPLLDLHTKPCAPDLYAPQTFHRSAGNAGRPCRECIYAANPAFQSSWNAHPSQLSRRGAGQVPSSAYTPEDSGEKNILNTIFDTLFRW